MKKKFTMLTWDIDSAEKGGYEDFILKEIHEQPKVVRDTLVGKIALGKEITLGNVKFNKEELENLDKIYIIACGIAYHADVVGKAVIEKLAKIPVEIDVASEFRYREPLITNKTLIIVVSQSGETAIITLLTQETLKDKMISNVREVSTRGINIFAVVNEEDTDSKEIVDSLVYIPKTIDLLTPMISVIPLELISYYVENKRAVMLINQEI